jgi:putative ABC transport system permease protein
MRKLLGASRSELLLQLVGESFLLSTLSLVFAFVIVSIILPEVNGISGNDLELGTLLSAKPMAFLGGIVVLLALAVGLYPALLVTKVDPIWSMRSMLGKRVKIHNVRRILVVFQMVLSVVLVSCTLMVRDQWKFLIHKPLGFDVQSVLNVPIYSQNLNSVFKGVDPSMRERLNAFEERLLNHEAVQQVTLSSGLPGVGTASRMIFPDDSVFKETIFVSHMAVDYDFTETYKLEIIAGRDFDANRVADQLEAFIINESAVKQFGWNDPAVAIGKSINLEGKEGLVIGVLKDFHMYSLRQPVESLILDLDQKLLSIISIRLEAGQEEVTIEWIERQWASFFPEKTFEYTLLNDFIDEQYQSELNLSKILGLFSMLAIFVSCLGAFGLVAMNAKQKEKEIAIRKIVGAPLPTIVIFLFREFTILFFIGYVIAVPLAWFVFDLWLDTFSYSVNMNMRAFVSSGAINLLVIWLTIGFQSVKTARVDPARLLRNE